MGPPRSYKDGNFYDDGNKTPELICRLPSTVCRLPSAVCRLPCRVVSTIWHTAATGSPWQGWRGNSRQAFPPPGASQSPPGCIWWSMGRSGNTCSSRHARQTSTLHVIPISCRLSMFANIPCHLSTSSDIAAKFDGDMPPPERIVMHLQRHRTLIVQKRPSESLLAIPHRHRRSSKLDTLCGWVTPGTNRDGGNRYSTTQHVLQYDCHGVKREHVSRFFIHMLCASTKGAAACICLHTVYCTQ